MTSVLIGCFSNTALSPLRPPAARAPRRRRPISRPATRAVHCQYYRGALSQHMVSTLDRASVSKAFDSRFIATYSFSIRHTHAAGADESFPFGVNLNHDEVEPRWDQLPLVVAPVPGHRIGAASALGVEDGAGGRPRRRQRMRICCWSTITAPRPGPLGVGSVLIYGQDLVHRNILQ